MTGRVNIFIIIATLFFLSCSPAARFQKSVSTDLARSSSIRNAHLGVSIYDAGTNKFIVGYNDTAYFVPASNTKIPTCYAAMKYLGDSIETANYRFDDDRLIVQPLGDPSFLHRDFKYQPLLALLKYSKADIQFNTLNWQAKHWGSGWAWSDYDAAYMAERSVFPMYGNVMQARSISDSTVRLPEVGELIDSGNLLC